MSNVAKFFISQCSIILNFSFVEIEILVNRDQIIVPVILY